MAKHSAGIMVYRKGGGMVEVFLVHPGGPFWAKKDKAAWSIPKGEFEPDNEDELVAARREFREETGLEVKGKPEFLGVFKQSSGKRVHAWVVEGDFDAEKVKSNSFEMEWPKGSGKHKKKFAEVDRAAWFDCMTAKQKLHKGQVPLIELLLEKLGVEQ